MQNSEKLKHLRAPAWITLALLAASIEPIVSKFALRDGISALQLVLLKNTIGAAFMLPVLIQQAKSLNGRLLQLLFLPGLLLFVTNTLTLLSLQTVSVVLLITIVSSVPALVAIINSRLGRDKLSLKFWAGFAACFLGIVLTLDYSDISVNALGLAFAFIAAISSSIYRVRMEILCEQNSPRMAAATSFFIQGLLSLSLVFFVPTSFAGKTLGYGCWIGLSAALANLAFISALNMVGSTRISVLTLLQRPLLIIAAAISLHEVVTPVQALGIILAMLGIWLAQVERQKITPQPADQLT